MKLLKVLLGVVGLVGLAVAGYFLVQSWLEVRNLWAIANSMRSTTSANPTAWVLLAAALGSVGGLLLGLAIGLPSQTRSAIRQQALQDASDVREAAIRQRVGTDNPPAIEGEQR